MRLVAFVAGAGLVLATIASILRTLVVPRGLHSTLAGNVFRSMRVVLIGFSKVRRRYEARDAILAVLAPVGIIVLLLIWLVVLLFGYTLLMYGTGGSSLFGSFREAGSSLFTL